jgi:hypothetical protein
MILGSGIRDPEKTYSGSRIQGSKSTQSRIPDPDPQHCNTGLILNLNMIKFVPIYLQFSLNSSY